MKSSTALRCDTSLLRVLSWGLSLDGTSWEVEPAQHLAHSSVLTSTGCQPAIASHYVSIPTINTNTMAIHTINTTNIMVIETINTTTTMDIFTATTILVIIARLQDTHPIHLYSILKVQCPQLDLFTVIQVEISDECVFPGFESKQANYKLQAT